jgi:hypothetical protein
MERVVSGGDGALVSDIDLREFESVEEAVAWADDWVKSRVPSGHVLDLTEGSKEHYRLFSRAFGRFVVQYEVEYTALAGIVERINYVDKANWPKHRALQYLLVASNARSFYSAVDRLARGYYEDCLTITRGLYETFVRCLFVACYPDDAYNAIVRDTPKGVRRFNLTNFLKDDLGLAWQTKYRVMSAFAHSNGTEVMAAVQRALAGEGKPELFTLRIRYREDLAIACIAFLNFTLLAYLRLCTEVLAQNFDPESEVYSTASDAVALLTVILTTNDKEYWRAAATDLGLIFRMLPIADSRGEWKSFLAAARAEPPHHRQS